MARLVALVAKSLSTGLSAAMKKIDVFILFFVETDIIDCLPVLAHMAFLVAVVAERKSSNLVSLYRPCFTATMLSLILFPPRSSFFLCLTAYQTD